MVIVVCIREQFNPHSIHQRRMFKTQVPREFLLSPYWGQLSSNIKPCLRESVMCESKLPQSLINMPLEFNLHPIHQRRHAENFSCLPFGGKLSSNIKTCLRERESVKCESKLVILDKYSIVIRHIMFKTQRSPGNSSWLPYIGVNYLAL